MPQFDSRNLQWLDVLDIIHTCKVKCRWRLNLIICKELLREAFTKRTSSEGWPNERYEEPQTERSIARVNFLKPTIAFQYLTRLPVGPEWNGVNLSMYHWTFKFNQSLIFNRIDGYTHDYIWLLLDYIYVFFYLWTKDRESKHVTFESFNQSKIVLVCFFVNAAQLGL